MIRAIFRLQSCTTIPGRRAFVGKGQPRHGIAAGHVRWYEIITPSWSSGRGVIAGVDSTGSRTMGFSNFGPETVESWTEVARPAGWSAKESRVRPMPLGWTPARPELNAHDTDLSWLPEGGAGIDRKLEGK